MKNSRWDYVGLAAERANPPFFAEHDVNGTTYLEVDTSDVYIRYNSNWYKLGAAE